MLRTSRPLSNTRPRNGTSSPSSAASPVYGVMLSIAPSTESSPSAPAKSQREHPHLRIGRAVFGLSRAARDRLWVREQAGRQVDHEVLRIAHRHGRVARAGRFGREPHGARQRERVARGLVEEVRFVDGFVQRRSVRWSASRTRRSRTGWLRRSRPRPGPPAHNTPGPTPAPPAPIPASAPTAAPPAPTSSQLPPRHSRTRPSARPAHHARRCGGHGTR